MYALTADNLLKMTLIMLRLRAKIPVIIMGETGCGKTSLVHYLSKLLDAKFLVFNFHAGVTEQTITAFMKEADTIASKSTTTFAFLDEINTCEHLGLINEMICHHSLQGSPLSPKLLLLAACNPYR